MQHKSTFIFRHKKALISEGVADCVGSVFLACYLDSEIVDCLAESVEALVVSLAFLLSLVLMLADYRANQIVLLFQRSEKPAAHAHDAADGKSRHPIINKNGRIEHGYLLRRVVVK